MGGASSEGRFHLKTFKGALTLLSFGNAFLVAITGFDQYLTKTCNIVFAHQEIEFSVFAGRMA